MSGSKTKTTPNSADVDAFLARTAADRRADADQLVAMLQDVTGEPPVLWGDSIVGFGSYRYRYDSGREGDSSLVGFSPRKAEFSIYLLGVYFPDSAGPASELLARLGRHRMGKACLYVRRLADIDLSVLRELVELSVAQLRLHYPDQPT